MRRNYETAKAELLRNPNIVSIAATSNVPGGRFNQNQIYWQDENGEQDVSQVRVDYDFFATLGIEMAEGRSFSKAMSTDSATAFILNETAARLYEWDTAVGKQITWLDDDDTRRGMIIGVAKDFHFQSLHRSIEPLIFHVLPDDFNYFLIKIGGKDISNTLADLEKKWRTLDPERAFEYTFLDSDFAALYNSEERMQAIVGNFSFLAILIACLGLFGLASFTMQQRTKEIGVRKVLGASITGIVLTLSKDFTRFVLMAFIVAAPLAYFAMNAWLQNFAYRTEIGFGVFAWSGLLAFVIALLTVSTQAIKAALANPVDSLRYE